MKRSDLFRNSWYYIQTKTLGEVIGSELKKCWDSKVHGDTRGPGSLWNVFPSVITEARRKLSKDYDRCVVCAQVGVE